MSTAKRGRLGLARSPGIAWNREPAWDRAAPSRAAARSLAAPRNLAAQCAALPGPEHLVGWGFRGWICGLRTGDLGCLERVWDLYSTVLEPREARAAVQSLAAWVNALRSASPHDIEVQPLGACDFCRDECLAISMIAASQHNTCPAMRACAFALIETARVDEVLHHAGTYALTLRSLDKIIAPQWIVNANAFIDAAPVSLH